MIKVWETLFLQFLKKATIILLSVSLHSVKDTMAFNVNCAAEASNVILRLFYFIFLPQIGLRRHYDADITDNDRMQGWLEGNGWLSWRSTESSSYGDSSSESHHSLDSSSESSESESSESESSEESSEELLITDQTTPAVTTTAMTTITTGDGSTLTPEPDTVSTGETNVTATPPGQVPTTPAGVTSPGNVTHCVTELIPTAAPITENRGDN